MVISLSVEEKYSLVTRRLELQNGWAGEKLHQLILGGKSIKYQWATTPTGKPHVGYFIPVVKFGDFIRSGGEVIIELLDAYGFLVNYKHPWEKVEHRTAYYKHLFTAILTAVGVPLDKVTMPLMTGYQGTPAYEKDLWKMVAACSQQDVKDATEEVGASKMLSPLLTPLLQELGEEYLGVDVGFGGTDQRGIFNIGERFLPHLGYDKRPHLLNELLPSLTGGKMSSSHPAHTKIMFLDDAETVTAKLAGAACPEKIVQNNGVLPILKHVVIPISELRVSFYGARQVQGHDSKYLPFTALDAPDGTLISVQVGEGEHRHYSTYEQLEGDYVEGILGPEDLRRSVASGLNQVLGQIREIYKGNKEWQVADRLGYPEDLMGGEAEVVNGQAHTEETHAEKSQLDVSAAPSGSNGHAGQDKERLATAEAAEAAPTLLESTGTLSVL